MTPAWRRSISLRDERELFIAASNGHVLAFDNLSGLSPWLSDTLCRLTSGGAFSTPSAVHRSGRNSACRRWTHHSQRDRGSHLHPDCGPRDPADARADCRTATPAGDCALAGVRAFARPRLGALLDAAAHGLQMLAQVRLQWLPRMADFALSAASLRNGISTRARRLRSRFWNNRRDAIKNIVDADPVAARARHHGRPSAMDRKRIRPFAGRRPCWRQFYGRLDPLWLAKGPAHSPVSCVGHRPTSRAWD